MEDIPEGLIQVLNDVIKKRLEKNPACIMNVRSILKKALRVISGNRYNVLDDYPDQNIKAAMYNETALALERQGGVLWSNSTRHNRDHKGPSTRVYKFESD
jgi:hypothetical protein